MKSKTALCVVLALTTMSANFAFAQTRSNEEEQARYRATGVDNRAPPTTREEAREYRRNEAAARRQDYGYGYGWQNNRYDVPRDYGHRWNRGDRLPPQYLDRQYIVNDWRGHRLSPPPRGYQWVQNGSDYLLVAIATGIIAELLLNH